MSEDPDNPKRTVIIRKEDMPGAAAAGAPPANPFAGSNPFAAAPPSEAAQPSEDAQPSEAVPRSDDTPPAEGGLPTQSAWPTKSALPPEPALPEPAAFAPPAFTAAPPPRAPTSPGGGRFGEAGSLVGATLNDNYEVTRYITRGGMGEIYEGRQMRGNAKVAIKVILPQFAADPEFYQLLEREADLLAQLGHDAIVKFRGLSQDPRSGVDYLTLEYVPGPSLEDRMDDGPVPPDQARALLRRLAAGLDTAHEKGVFHRDLSPDNILLRDGHIERATIIDFGIAKDADTSKKTIIGAGFGGKLGFAAPEAFGLFGRQIGAWTDIYSLALVVAAAARAEFIDMGTATPIDAINARQSVPPLDGIEPWLASVLAQMLEPDPADRLRSMGAVIKAVDALPPVGTLFTANKPPPAAGAATIFAPIIPDDDAAPAATTFVRTSSAAESTTAAEKPKSRTPLYVGGGVAVALVVGIAVAFSGGDKEPAPDAEPEIAAAATSAAVDAAAPVPAATTPAVTAPAAPAADWVAARGTLAGLPCSDVRAIEPGDATTSLQLVGWASANTRLPATAGGYRLDTSGVARISPAPDPETCAIFGQLKAAASDAGVLGTLRTEPQKVWRFSELKKSGDTYDIPNFMRSTGKRLFIANIEEGRNVENRVASSPLKKDLQVFQFQTRQPVRYLQMFVSSNSLPYANAETGDGSGIRKACQNDCTTTSGWVELK
jgi:serine/threonine protein kinase